MDSISKKDSYFGFVRKLSDRSARSSRGELATSVTAILDDQETERSFEFELKPGSVLSEFLNEEENLEIPVCLQAGEDRKPIFLGAFSGTIRSIVFDSEYVFVLIGFMRCHLSRSHPKFEEILSKLQASYRDKQDYWYSFLDEDRTVRGSNELLDVFFRRTPISKSEGPSEFTFDESRMKPIPVCWADRLFQNIVQKSAEPGKYQSDGIPFRYVSDGCEHRAHLISRMLLKWNIEPYKVWIFPSTKNESIRFRTTDHPNQEVFWAAHVAPAVLTTEGFRVLDPLVDYRQTVSVEQWRQRISDQKTRIYWTSHQVLSTGPSQSWIRTDPTFEETQLKLKLYRLNLYLLWERMGLPPYHNSELAIELFGNASNG